MYFCVQSQVTGWQSVGHFYRRTLPHKSRHAQRISHIPYSICFDSWDEQRQRLCNPCCCSIIPAHQRRNWTSPQWPGQIKRRSLSRSNATVKPCSLHAWPRTWHDAIKPVYSRAVTHTHTHTGEESPLMIKYRELQLNVNLKCLSIFCRLDRVFYTGSHIQAVCNLPLG